MAERCEVCGGSGFEVHARADGVMTAARCACQEQDVEAQLLRQARIPRRYDHCSLDTFECQPPQDASLRRAHRAAQEWIELWPTVRRGLLLHGPPGTGKTHLAVAIARELIRTKRAHVLFHEHRELLKALQDTFDAGSAQRESEVLRPVLDVEVLVLDDLGAGRITAWNRDVMHDVIAQRYNEVRPLILTTNHKIEAVPEAASRRSAPGLEEPLTLRDRLGDALMSRLYEMCEVIEMRGRDYRIWVSQHSRRG